MVNSAQFNYRNQIFNNPNLYGGNYHGYICDGKGDQGIFFGRANQQEAMMMRQRLYEQYRQPKEPSGFVKFFQKFLLPIGMGILGGLLGGLFNKGKTEGTETEEPVETPSTEPVETPSTEPVETPSIEPVETPSTEPVETPSTEPVEQSTAEQLAELFDENGCAEAHIEASATGLGKDYNGKIMLPKGAKFPDEGFPPELRMTLPDAYGKNQVMKLTLVKGMEDKGIYETSAHDRQFQIEIKDGQITMKTVTSEELNALLQKHINSWGKPVYQSDPIDVPPPDEMVADKTAVYNNAATEEMLDAKYGNGNSEYVYPDEMENIFEQMLGE